MIVTEPVRRTLAILVVVLAALTAVTAVLLESWLGDLPDPVAIHWGPAGVADAFTSRAALPWLALLTPGIGLLIGVAGVLATTKLATMRVGLVGVAVGVAAFGNVLVLLLVAGQRGLGDSRAASLPAVSMVWALLAAVALGVAVAALAPGEDRAKLVAREAIPPDVPRLSLTAGETAVWVRWETMATSAYAVLAVVVLPTVVLVVLASAWALLIVMVAVVLVVAAMSSFRVAVGPAGVAVRSVVGWPRFRVAVTEVAAARMVRVHPLRDFGGWGVRVGADGRYGVVLRGGEALEIERGDGSVFVVTVADATEAAALINTVAERQRVGQG